MEEDLTSKPDWVIQSDLVSKEKQIRKKISREKKVKQLTSRIKTSQNLSKSAMDNGRVEGTSLQLYFTYLKT